MQAKVIEIGSIIAAVWAVKAWVDGLCKIIQPLIVEIEKRALDKKIDRPDRKMILMTAISILETEKKIKLNFFTRRIVYYLVDFIAGKLPDFTITQNVESTIDKAVGNGFLGKVDK